MTFINLRFLHLPRARRKATENGGWARAGWALPVGGRARTVTPARAGMAAGCAPKAGFGVL